jgi:hypothetical protein
MRSSLLVVAIALLAAACSPAPDGGDGDLGGLEAPAGGKGDGIEDDPLAETIRARYGVRPRRYGAFFAGSSSAENAFLAALEPVTTAINARLTGPFAGLDLLEPELATNFIVEGGYYALVEDVTVDIESFYHLGLDSLVSRLPAMRPLISPAVAAWISDPANQYSETNEKGVRVTGVWFASMHDALEASAAMFILSRRDFAADYRAMGGNTDTLGDAAWFFWTTVYFNGGSAAGRQALHTHGVQWVDKAWTRADDPTRYGNIIQFNALWRTASYEYLSASEYE